MLGSSEEALAVCRRVDPVYASTTLGTEAQLVECTDNGSVLMAMYASGRVTLADPTTGSIRSVIKLAGGQDGGDEDDGESAHVIGAMSLCSDGSVITSTLDANLVEIWQMSGDAAAVPARSFKTHASPIMVMAHHRSLPLLATGSADCSVRVWDSQRSYCTHHLQSLNSKSKRLSHRSAISCLFFSGGDDSPHQEDLKLVSGSEDGVVCVWDLTNSLLIDAKQDHSSAVTAIQATDSFLLTAGRDQMVYLYELDEHSTSSINPAVMSLAVMEAVESAGIIDVHADGSVLFYTAGLRGVVRVWKWTSSSASATLVAESQCLVYSTMAKEGEMAEHGIRRVFYLSRSCRLVVTTSEMNVFVLKTSDLSIDCMFVGHLGEVTDLNVLSNSTGLLAVATNGSDVKLVSSSSSASLGDMDCKDSCSSRMLKVQGVLSGRHSLAVLCLASLELSIDGQLAETLKGHYLVVSGSRDNMAVVWMVSGSGKCLASVVLEGHSKEVTAVCLGRDAQGGLVVLTGSADSTLSVWDLTIDTIDGSDEDDEVSAILQTTRRWSIKGHGEGDVNAVMLTPDGLKIVSAGQDRRACVWSLSDGSRVFEFEGHRRGIWHAALSPTEQIVATASADCTIRIWSLISGQCLRTMEGLSQNSTLGAASVLRVLFAPDGKSLITASGDGIMRMWDVGSGVMIGSVMDYHMDRIWAMCVLVSEEENSVNCVGRGDAMTVVTGDASGCVMWWRDVREELEAKHEEERKQFLLDQQKLSNLEYQGQWKDAAHLAVQLDQPFRLYYILCRLIDDRLSSCSSGVVDGVGTAVDLLEAVDERIKAVIDGLIVVDDESGLLDRLFKYALQWNTSLKRAFVAQSLVRCILALVVHRHQMDLSVEQRQVLKQFASYTERHNERVNDLMISSHIIDYCLAE